MTMNHHDTIDLFLVYSSGKLTGTDRARVDQHLESCAKCRSAYQRLHIALEPGSRPHQLTADPFLPTRIRAMAESTSTATRILPAVQWSLVMGLAILLGILLGSDISRDRSQSYSSNDVVDEFATSLSAPDLSDKWYSAANTNGGDRR